MQRMESNEPQEVGAPVILPHPHHEHDHDDYEHEHQEKEEEKVEVLHRMISPTTVRAISFEELDATFDFLDGCFEAYQVSPQNGTELTDLNDTTVITTATVTTATSTGTETDLNDTSTGITTATVTATSSDTELQQQLQHLSPLSSPSTILKHKRSHQSRSTNPHRHSRRATRGETEKVTEEVGDPNRKKEFTQPTTPRPSNEDSPNQRKKTVLQFSLEATETETDPSNRPPHPPYDTHPSSSLPLDHEAPGSPPLSTRSRKHYQNSKSSVPNQASMRSSSRKNRHTISVPIASIQGTTEPFEGPTVPLSSCTVPPSTTTAPVGTFWNTQSEKLSSPSKSRSSREPPEGSTVPLSSCTVPPSTTVATVGTFRKILSEKPSPSKPRSSREPFEVPPLPLSNSSGPSTSAAPVGTLWKNQSEKLSSPSKSRSSRKARPQSMSFNPDNSMVVPPLSLSQAATTDIFSKLPYTPFSKSPRPQSARLPVRTPQLKEATPFPPLPPLSSSKKPLSLNLSSPRKTPSTVDKQSSVLKRFSVEKKKTEKRGLWTARYLGYDADNAPPLYNIKISQKTQRSKAAQKSPYFYELHICKYWKEKAPVVPSLEGEEGNEDVLDAGSDKENDKGKEVEKDEPEMPTLKSPRGEKTDRCILYRTFAQFLVLREKLKKKGLFEKDEESPLKDTLPDVQQWLNGMLTNDVVRADKDFFLFLEPYQIGDEKELTVSNKDLFHFC